jgi:hypothetical protein
VTPEQIQKMREMYADNLIELMALQPELFDDKEADEGINEPKEPSEPESPSSGSS